MIKLSSIKRNPANPRTIQSDRMDILVQSLTDFPDMMAKRPIVIDSWDNPIALGGNQRLAALETLGYDQIPDNWVVTAEGWTEEQKKQFIIRDNIDFGEWDIQALEAGGWSIEQLTDWGVEIPTPSTTTIPSSDPTDKLKPCPFCGGEAIIKPEGKSGLRLKCTSCLIGIKQSTIRYDLVWLREKMIEGWNNRVTDNHI